MVGVDSDDWIDWLAIEGDGFRGGVRSEDTFCIFASATSCSKKPPDGSFRYNTFINELCHIDDCKLS